MSGLKAAAIGISGTDTILTKHGLNGSLEDLVVKIFPKIPRHDTKMSYEHKQAGVDLHYIVENKFIYLVANVREDEDTMTKRIPFTYLDDIKQKFKVKYGGGPDKYPDVNSMTESQCRPFDTTMKERMIFCNDKDKVKTIQKQMDEVKDIMEKNLDTLLERGDKINTLVQKTEEIDSEVCRHPHSLFFFYVPQTGQDVPQRRNKAENDNEMERQKVPHPWCLHCLGDNRGDNSCCRGVVGLSGVGQFFFEIF